MGDHRDKDSFNQIFFNSIILRILTQGDLSGTGDHTPAVCSNNSKVVIPHVEKKDGYDHQLAVRACVVLNTDDKGWEEDKDIPRT